MNSTQHVPNGGLRKSAGISVAAMLLFSAVAVVLSYSPINAQAQTISIAVSADRFFGNSFLQVIVTNPSANTDSTSKETTSATVIIRDNTNAVRATGSIDAREIGTNSGQFEFFVTTSNDDPAAPRSETIPANAAVFRFNNPPPTPTADTNDTVVNTGAKPANNWRVEIQYPGAASRTVNFQTSSAQFNIDRTVAGSGSNTIFTITDQDANIDPTARNIIVGTSTGTNLMIGANTLITGTFPTGTYVFEETGDNTGVFERTFSLAALGDPSVSPASTQNYVLRNFDVYQTGGTTANADASGTSIGQVAQTSINLFVTTPTSTTTTRSLIFQNSDGILTAVPQVTFAGGIPITVTDSDVNQNTRSEDSITSSETVGVRVAVDALGGDVQFVDITETDENTGTFIADLSNGVLPVVFINSNAPISPVPAAGELKLRPSDIQNGVDILIEYRDPNTAAGSNELTSSLRVPITTTPGQLALDSTTVTSTGTAMLILTDPDLNVNSEGIDSYTVTIPAAATTTGRFDFTGFGNLAQLEIRIRGSTSYTPAAAQTLVFIETGPNTGVFTAELEMQDLATNFSDGDQVQVRYRDMMQSPAAESVTTITVGRPSSSITVDRTVVPVPLQAVTSHTVIAGDAPTAAGLGTAPADAVKFRLTIVDPVMNTNSAIQNTISTTSTPNAISFDQVTTSTGATLTTGSASTNQVQITGLSLTETGPNTGVFTGMVTIAAGDGTGGAPPPGPASLTQLNNAKLVLRYDGNTATVTLRTSDLVVSADKTVVRNGEQLTITVIDADRNLDPETKDGLPIRIRTQSEVISTANKGMLLTTARETGPNTGVFTKTITIGTDIRVTEIDASTVTQASQLRIDATDRSTTGNISTTRDLTLRVGTQSGSITVTPEQIGPGSKLTILVQDNDLNVNPAGVDTIASTVEYLTITTDRTNFQPVNAGGEETGPNTGIFESTVQLTPKTTAATVAPAAATVGGTAGKDVSNFEVLPGDLISVRYVDAKNAANSKVTVSTVVQVVSQDPIMTADKTAYQAGETILLTIEDLDANIDGDVVDSLRVRVTSTSDPVGLDVTGLETGPNTGVFTFSIPTTTTVSSGSVTVSVGDTVTIRYTDKYPADYADRVRLVADPSKEFHYTVVIGAAASVGSTTPSAPALRDVSGNVVTQVMSNQQVILSVDIQNNEPGPRTFAAIVEVRDANGFTVKLDWQTGTIQAGGTANIGLSWTPDMPGQYTVRTFVVTQILNPSALSPIAQSTVTVS